MAAWLVAIVVAHHEYAVNDLLRDRVVTCWPADSQIIKPAGQPMLVLFLHPKCPCSNTSVTELYRLYSSLEEKPGVLPNLVATVPAASDESWLHTATIKRAARLVDSRLHIDRGGQEATKFGATTSGFVMLFDGLGTRRFAGGITVGRGHEGPSVGGDCLTEILRGEHPEVDQLPVFGCRLCLPEPSLHNDVVKRTGQGRLSTQSG